MNKSKLALRFLAVLFIFLIALALRWRAVNLLPIDYDEDDYLRAGQQYATAIQNGDWAAFTQENYRAEHPPLEKIIYGVAIASLPPAPEIPDRPTTAPPAPSLPQPHLLYARAAAALFGSLEVFILALFSPLAALLLAIHTWDIKYVSQVQVEAAPAFTSALAVLAYYRSNHRWNRWLVLSAIALGLTAAGKYTYCIVGAAIVIDWLWREHQAAARHNLQAISRALVPVALWGMLAVAIFFAADPYLWPDPINRLRESLFYHFGYAQSEGVTSANLPMWQPLVWLAGSVPWHPGVFLFMLDAPITILAALGLPSLWRKYRVLALWLLIGFAFLIVWPTKWPQYVLTLSVPLTVAAAGGLRDKVWLPLSMWARRLWASARAPRRQTRAGGMTRAFGVTWRETRFALPWLIPGMVVLGLITLFPFLYEGAMSLTDFSALSIRDGLNGGIMREVWRGVTGQVAPVIVSFAENGRITTQVVLADRGEPAMVPIGSSGLNTREVHYAGPSFLANLFTGVGPDLLVFDVLWTVLSVGLQAVFGIVIALILNQRGLFAKRWWRTLFILPWAIPEFVGALMWQHIFEPTHGWLSLLLQTPIYWQSDPQMALGVLLLASLWLGFPLMMLAATAGLSLIPKEVDDAAAVDGASRWTRFRYITFPLLLPLLAPALIIRTIFAFNQFYLFYVMRPPYPLMTLATISFYLFDATRGFGGQFAVSAAINIFTAIVLLLFLIGFNRQTRAAEGVTYA
ncbi:MAG: ABC transporter permease subunit [Anaerolineae bacterium]